MPSATNISALEELPPFAIGFTPCNRLDLAPAPAFVGSIGCLAALTTAYHPQPCAGASNRLGKFRIAKMAGQPKALQQAGTPGPSSAVVRRPRPFNASRSNRARSGLTARGGHGTAGLDEAKPRTASGCNGTATNRQRDLGFRNHSPALASGRLAIRGSLPRTRRYAHPHSRCFCAS